MRTIRFTRGVDLTYVEGDVHIFDEGVADAYVNVRRVAEYIDVPVPRSLIPPQPFSPSRSPEEPVHREPAEIDPTEHPDAAKPDPKRRKGRPREIARTGAAPARPHH
jgi:hypothetical protein